MSRWEGESDQVAVQSRSVADALQVKFGARTGFAPVLLGLVKLGLGLLLGSSLAELFRAFPEPLLGSLLIFSGVCAFLAATTWPQPHPIAACHCETTYMTFRCMGQRILIGPEYAAMRTPPFRTP